MRGFIVNLLMVLLLAGGCSHWEIANTEEKPWQLQAPHMTPDSVVLEVAFIRSTPTSEAEVEQLWREVDEQAIDARLRQRLYANGIRCGLLGAHLPPTVHRLLAVESPSAQVDSTNLERQDHDVTSKQYRLQNREGQRATVATTGNFDVLNVFLNDAGVVRGETFQNAQGVFGLRSFPKGDGRVRIELVPEIEHGEPRNRRVGSEGVWRLEFSRDRATYDPLRIETWLSPGQTLVISCTPERIGLGASFFAKSNLETASLLIRVAQTQKDELFETIRPRTPIATTGE